jgi:hypothetical protein
VTIVADPVPATTVLVDGRAKAAPYTLLFLANPVVKLRDGTLTADPIQVNRRAFHETAAKALAIVFGSRERVLAPYAHEIRVVARFAAAPIAAANALCRQRAGGGMSTDQAATVAFVGGLGLAADHVFVVFRSRTNRRDATAWSVEDAASDGLAWTLDGTGHQHRRRSSRPGTTVLSSPTDAITALHELLHGADITDLYVDSVPARFAVNKKRRASLRVRRPAQYASLDGVAYATDLSRDGIGYPRSWLSYHPQLVDARRPNAMDNYYQADNAARCRLDLLTLRYLRDRMEWKLQR